MKEAPVEQRLKAKLEAHGFKVLKLVTPGTAGTMDRLILRPRWSPGPPWVIEAKRPRKSEERLQEIVRDDWRSRGVLVLDMVDTYEKVDALADRLVAQCVNEAPLSVEAIAHTTLYYRGAK
jgi:hypothetical protein